MSKNDRQMQGRMGPGTVLETGATTPQLEGSNTPSMNAPRELQFNSKKAGSNVDAEGYFVDHDGVRMLDAAGQPIEHDATFSVTSRRSEGYHKAGKKFGVEPTEVVFKALTPEQQRNLLAAAPHHLVVNRSRFTNNGTMSTNAPGAVPVNPDAKIDIPIDTSGVKVSKS